jgi:hypothetical protein
MFNFSSGSLKRIADRPSLFTEASCRSQSPNNNDSETSNEVRVKLVSRESPLIVFVIQIHSSQKLNSNTIDAINVSLGDGTDVISNAILDASQWQRIDQSLLNKLNKDKHFQSLSTYSDKNLNIGSVILIHEYSIKQLDQVTRVINILDFTIIGKRLAASDCSSSSSSLNKSIACDSDQLISMTEALAVLQETTELEHVDELTSISANWNPDAFKNIHSLTGRKDQTEPLANTKLQQDPVQPNELIDDDDTVTSKLAPSHQIKDLSPACKNNWSILVRLLKKTPILNGKSPSMVYMRLLFADLTGKIEAVAFREKIREHNLDSFEENQIFRISNGSLAIRRNPAYRAWTAVTSVNFDLHIEKAIKFDLVDERVERRLCSKLDSVMLKVELDCTQRSQQIALQDTTNKPTTLILGSKSENPNKVYPLDQVCLFHNETKLNIIAIIEHIGEVENMNAKNYASNLKVRRVSLIDNTNVSVVCQFFGKEATKFEYKVGDILLIGKVVAKPYNKKISLCIYRETIVNVLNESSSLAPYKTLKEWWNEKQTANKEDQENDNQPKSKRAKFN